MRRRLRAALGAALSGALVTLLAVFAAPSAQAATHQLPDILGCTNAPTPEMPGRGVVGFFESPPKTLPPPGDPFVPNSTTTIHQQYGYAGLRWNTYDLGCGPDIARSPDAAVGTSVANWILTVPKAMVAATGAIMGAAFEPDFLGVFDPLVTKVVQTLQHAVFEQWAFVVIAALGLLLVWRARHASMASSTAAVGWALFVMVLVTVVLRWPLSAGHAADETVTSTMAAVTGGLNGTAPNATMNAAEQATASMHDALLYQAWLGGTFGDANSDVAKRYGPVIFDSQALTWREADTLRRDPARGEQIIDQKKKTFEETADKIKTEDPDAYEYLTGKRSDTRVGYALLAGLATLCAVPFLLMAGLLVLGALIIVRFGVMLFPAFATLGLFPTMRSLVIGIGNTMASAIINAIIFGIGSAVTVKGIGVLLSPSTTLPPWLDIVLVLLLTVVMWIALRPFRRLTHMVSRERNHFGAAAGGVGTVSRGVARTGGRIITTAIGTFLGVAAANKATDDEDQKVKTPDGVPQRAEAVTSYEPATLTGPVSITAGSVTVTSAGDSGSGVPAGVGGGPTSSSGAGTGASGVGSPAPSSGSGSPLTPSRVEASGTPDRGSRDLALAGANGSSGSNGSGGSAAARTERALDRGGGGRFEASGAAGRDVPRTNGTRRPAPARPNERSTGNGGRHDPGADLVDLSDYDFDELAEIFRPDQHRVRSEANRTVEAGRGR